MMMMIGAGLADCGDLGLGTWDLGHPPPRLSPELTQAPT